MGLDDIRQMPGHLIRRAQQTISALFAEEVGDQDLTSVQFAALTVIGETSGIDATGLSVSIALDRATIGGVIDRLQAKGLIRREASDTDRRVKRLYLTSPGIEAVSRALPAVLRAQHRLLTALDEADQAVFLRLLAQIVAAHDTPVGPGPRVRADQPAS